MPEFITIDANNFRSEHLCCAIGDDRQNQERCDSKRSWLAGRFAEGLVFRRLDARGKVFIEYMPVESVWKPLVGSNCLIINCLWVSGQFKGQGLAKQLLEGCLVDARRQGSQGVAVVVASTKKPFLADKKFFLGQGFAVCDTAPPWFELLWLPLHPAAQAPRFADHVRAGMGGSSQGISFVWSRQCPFMASVVASLAQVAHDHGHTCTTVELTSSQQAQSMGSPFGTLGIYWNGRFVTHELMTPQKFATLVANLERGETTWASKKTS